MTTQRSDQEQGPRPVGDGGDQRQRARSSGPAGARPAPASAPARAVTWAAAASWSVSPSLGCDFDLPFALACPLRASDGDFPSLSIRMETHSFLSTV